MPPTGTKYSKPGNYGRIISLVWGAVSGGKFMEIRPSEEIPYDIRKVVPSGRHDVKLLSNIPLFVLMAFGR